MLLKHSFLCFRQREDAIVLLHRAVLRPVLPSFLFFRVLPAKASASPCDRCSQIFSSHVRSFVMAGLDIFLRTWPVSKCLDFFSTVTFSSPPTPKSKCVSSPGSFSCSFSLFCFFLRWWCSAGHAPQSLLLRLVLLGPCFPAATWESVSSFCLQALMGRTLGFTRF